MPELNQNPLTMDFGAVDTSFRVLAAGNYELLTKKAELQDVKAPGTGKFIYLELVNIAPAQDTTGAAVEANSITIFDRINLQPSGKSTWTIVNRSIASLVQSVPGGIQPAPTPANYDAWVPTLAGKVLKARVDVDPEATREGRTYPKKNSIAYYIKA